MMTLPSPDQTFADLAPTSAEHFRLAFFASVSHLLRQVSLSYGSLEAAFEAFPFLSGYADEIMLRGLEAPPETAWWAEALEAFEARSQQHLPLRALRLRTDLSPAELSLFMAVGLPEEDARFGLLFEAMQVSSGQQRPTLGLFSAWWQGSLENPRATLQRLQTLGLVQLLPSDAPRLTWALQVPSLLWDALRSATLEAEAPWLRYVPATALPESLVWPDSLQATLDSLPLLLERGQLDTLIVRGAAHNGRMSLLGTLAQRLGLGLLEGRGIAALEHGRLLGPLAIALRAMPVLRLELAPSETVQVPSLTAYRGPLGIVLSSQGGLEGPGLGRALSLNLELPAPEERQRLWQRTLDRPTSDLAGLAGAFRLSRGMITQAAQVMAAQASLHGHTEPTLDDLRHATRLLNRQALEGLATPLQTYGDWNHLAAGAATRHELVWLERRIRQRERLPAVLGQTPHSSGIGVRALFSGPSGSGKTLAARLLAGVLGKDLYRLDLAGVVNKYLGETEKNLEKVFSRAEELDVVLLLDEGDALLTARTGVQSANDRYANLETDYLLQRLESFTGVLLITTNAAKHIDAAFGRRMDVVVEFRAPETPERLVIWQLHLPKDHRIGESFLQQVAYRCTLSGGQIRNAALHGVLLALQEEQALQEEHLEQALLREYYKMGQVCPLRK